MRGLIALCPLFLVACSSGPIDQMESLVVEFCACKDDACRERVSEKSKAWQEKNSDKISDANRARVIELGKRWLKCQQSVSGSIGAFKKYKARSQTTEAQMMLKRMIDGARAYYLDEHVGATGFEPVERQFPGPSVGPTPALGECCKQGGKCAPNAAQWDHTSWIALQFSVDDPHYYSYKYELSADGKRVTATAMGDLDCDGEYSTFELSALINADISDEPTLVPMRKEKPLE